MKSVPVKKFYKGGGFRTAVATSQYDKVEAIIAFGRETGAIINEGAGEIILIETPKGSQYILPVEGLPPFMNDLNEL